MDTRHVGWDSTQWGQHNTSFYHDPIVTAWISDAVTLKTMGLDKRPIRVTNRVINDVVDSFLNNHRLYSGDMYTRYHIPGDGPAGSGDFGRYSLESLPTPPEVVNSKVGLSSNHLINQVVEFMVEYLTTEYGINTNNKRYSAWSALYGANDFGLRAHPQIKTRSRRPIPFQFHMKF
jgi:hypothetical protein